VGFRLVFEQLIKKSVGQIPAGLLILSGHIYSPRRRDNDNAP
jgi:hypothetical protein